MRSNSRPAERRRRAEVHRLAPRAGLANLRRRSDHAAAANAKTPVSGNWTHPLLFEALAPPLPPLEPPPPPLPPEPPPLLPPEPPPPGPLPWEMSTPVEEETPSTVAVTAAGKSPVLVPAVNTPFGVIRPAVASALHVTGSLIGFPNESLACAENCTVPPTATVGCEGVMATTVTGPGVTVTEAVAAIPSAAACTVLAKVPGASPAVNSPEALIVPPPWSTDQVGVTATAFPCPSKPLAMKETVSPAAKVALSGVMARSDRAPAEIVTLAVFCTLPDGPVVATIALV